jgi:hypothetical protein
MGRYLNRLRRNRLVVLLTACALIACSAVYAAHDIGYGGHVRTHCDLCSHFSGSAGSPASAKVAGKPVLIVRVAPLRTELPRIIRSPLGPYLPRGPPSSLAA